MTLATQWVTLSLMFASGAVLGVLLDIYRLLVSRFRWRGWPVSLVDLLFWVSAACFVFAVLLWSNWGEMRFYIMLAIIAGLVCYFRLLTATVSKLLAWLFRVIERVIHWLLRIVFLVLYRPIAGIIHYIWRSISILLRFVWKLITTPICWLLRPLFAPYWRKLKSWWAARKKGDDEADE